jgi:hypothetical protein
MKIVHICLMTGFAFNLPFVAVAQQSMGEASAPDISYCKALGRTYSRMFPVQEGMPAADVMTIERCDTDARTSIATLEKKLKGQKIELPPHESVAQPPGSRGKTE